MRKTIIKDLLKSLLFLSAVSLIFNQSIAASSYPVQTFNADTTIAGTLLVTQPTTLTSLTTSNSIFGGDSLTITGSSTLSNVGLSGTLMVAGPATLSSLTTSGSLLVGGDFTASGSTTLNNVDVTGLLNVTGTLKVPSLIVTGSELIGGTLTISGSTTSQGNILANNRVDVLGQFAVANATTLNSLTATGSTLLQNSLTVTGSTTLQGPVSITAPTTITSLTTTGSQLIGGNLTVTGSTTLGDVTLVSLNISGATSFDALQITNTLTIGSNNNIVQRGSKLLASNITTSPSSIFTVNFTGATGCCFAHVIIFGTTVSGNIKYDAWVFLATNNATVQSSATNVTAGATPSIIASFTTGAGTATLNLNTLMAGTISNPYLFYEVYGTNVSTIS